MQRYVTLLIRKVQQRMVEVGIHFKINWKHEPSHQDLHCLPLGFGF